MGSSALRTVEDQFSLVENIRKYTPHNNRKYIVNAIRATLESPEVKEKIALGECFGYYGHTNRALYHRETNRLDLPESCTVTIDGQKVVLQNVPSNRTLAISIDDNGIVTHTQELLDTDPGRIVDAMDRSQAGGWSWATGGRDATRSYVSSFHGCDYVTTPNYVSLKRSAAMLESVGDLLQWRIEGFKNDGFTEQGARDILAHFDVMQREELMLESTQRSAEQEAEILFLQGRVMEMEQLQTAQAAMLESANASRSRRLALVESADKHLPVFLTDPQRQALINMETPEDLKIISAMFESIQSGGLATLPLGPKDLHSPAPRTVQQTKIGTVETIMPFGSSLL